MTHPMVPSREFKVRASDANINVNDRFTDEEIEKMRNWLSWHWSDPTAGKRYRWKERGRYQLLFEFLLRTGGRISEVLALRVRDIDLNSSSITLRTLKQKRKDAVRTIPLHPELRKAYLNYISSPEFRNRIIAERKLFPMSRSAVDQFLKKMGSELGIKVHAHKFRHTFAVSAILSDVPLNILQGWLGHTNIWTTNTYTKAIGVQTQEYMNRMK